VGGTGTKATSVTRKLLSVFCAEKMKKQLMLMLIKFQELKKLNEADGMIFQTETQLKKLGENYLMRTK
jgi:hypothetical protein